ncbi:DUF924 domain-containing protein [Allosphingosinicella flava]|uniref:DUF924 domain-containing protein n=1 Tax=Allosphingosinicella flava TaxID=2771430 RepID=A0A7T2LNL9_9SPHN|nr:DUF924 family protein [Sphingosinicella flava]QPQ56317.1 DUF924 domain-containing protein [Sphingosinicella flava]
MERQDEILDFWFGLTREQWWTRDDALDAAIRVRFLELWKAEQAHSPDHFTGSPDAALAAVILFDQFPRNMFRDDPRSFATDPLALAITNRALSKGYFEALPQERRAFLIMPLQHSEDLSDQERSVELFRALGDDFSLGFAIKHRDVIARFGRFPHRNAVLGRQSRPEEREFGLTPPW